MSGQNQNQASIVVGLSVGVGGSGDATLLVITVLDSAGRTEFTLSMNELQAYEFATNLLDVIERVFPS